MSQSKNSNISVSNPRPPLSRKCLLSALLLILSCSAIEAYQARPWKIKTSSSYPSRLSSEGVTIAVEPLFLNNLAAQVFDKSDMVTRGIMPLAIVIFNDNDFAVRIDETTIEMVSGERHYRTRMPEEAVALIFKKDSKRSLIPNVGIPLPASGGGDANTMEDFEQKYLGNKTVGPHEQAGGFLYMQLPAFELSRENLAKAVVYIPDIVRIDTRKSLIFFEVDLKPAVDAVPIR
jgi:hypothetical protein